jgi:SAM-dependent methyltransferase
MKPRRPTPLPLCLAALFGLFLGFSLNSFSTFSYPDDHERLEQLELCQQQLTQNQQQLSSSMSSALSSSLSLSKATKATSSVSKPKTVEEARKNLATALVQAWDLDSDQALWSNKRGSVSAPRALVTIFMRELSQQLGNHDKKIGPACLDWSLDYMRGFPACTELYNYRYSKTDPQFHEATKDVHIDVTGVSDTSLFGLVQGDLGEDMEHVPSSIIDFAIVTQVFEHVPHFWNAMPNLHRLVKPGGVVAFTVPFCYQFHPYPGDFYRYSPMALIHMFESSGFCVCQMVSGGWRSVQMHALGLELPDIDDKMEYLTVNRSAHSLLIGASDYALIAQKLQPGERLEQGCSLPRLSLTNELLIGDLKAYAHNYWPQPMPNFPFGKAHSAA